MTTRLLLVATIFCLSVAFPIDGTRAAQYEFVNVIDTGGESPSAAPFTYHLVPAIHGETAAFLSYYQGWSKHTLYAGNGAPPSPVMTNGDPSPVGPIDVIRDPAIGENAAAFVGHFGQGQQGVFTKGNGIVTTIAKTGDITLAGPFISFDSYLEQHFPFVSISGDTVAFRGVMEQARHYNEGIFTGSGGALTTIAKTGDPVAFPGFTDLTLARFGDPAISGDTVAFRASYGRGGQFGGGGIFTGNGGPLTSIVQPGDPAPAGRFSEFSDPSISGDSIAFIATYDSNPGPLKHGLFVSREGYLETIVKTGDPVPGGGVFTYLLGTGWQFNVPSIAGNSVAFMATYQDDVAMQTINGVFVSRNGQITSVIKKGDPLFGSTVRFVAIGKFGLDPTGSGNLAFSYQLANNRQGIAIARFVPEPMSIVLAAGSLLLFALRRQR
jgi:hypothetical protein